MGYDDLALSYGNLMLLLGLARIGPSSVVARLGTLLRGYRLYRLGGHGDLPDGPGRGAIDSHGRHPHDEFPRKRGKHYPRGGASVRQLRERPTLAHLPAHYPDDGGSCRNRICPPVPDAAPRRALRSCQSVLRRDAVSLAAHDFNPVARVGA